MTTLRRWDDHTIDRTIRAVNAHQTQRARRRAIRQFLRAIVPMIRIRKG